MLSSRKIVHSKLLIILTKSPAIFRKFLIGSKTNQAKKNKKSRKRFIYGASQGVEDEGLELPSDYSRRFSRYMKT
jgi:hypothetical protein